MKKLILSAIVLMSANAFAAEITPSTLVGRYSVEAKVLFKRIYANVRINNTKDFEFQQTDGNGKGEEICTGTYTLNSSLFLVTDTMLASGKVLNGVATCPSDRSKKMDLSIDFEDTTTDDLVRGTTLKMRTSLGGGVRLNAFVKKQ